MHANISRRAFNGLAQGIAAQRCHFDALTGIHRPQVRRHEVGVEVGAQRQNQRAVLRNPERLQCSNESRLFVTISLGEQLFELIDQEQQPFGRRVRPEQGIDRIGIERHLTCRWRRWFPTAPQLAVRLGAWCE